MPLLSVILKSKVLNIYIFGIIKSMLENITNENGAFSMPGQWEHLNLCKTFSLIGILYMYNVNSRNLKIKTRI